MITSCMTKVMLLVRQPQFAAAPNNQFRQHGRLWLRCKAEGAHAWIEEDVPLLAREKK